MSGLTSNETVTINDLTLCHKHSAIGFVRATLPDVCRSPVAPVPYANVAYARDLENGTVTVRSHGGAMNGVKGSRFYPSYDDEPGTGGGVTSGVNRHEATWLSWSPNVFMEGRPVTRLTDKMLMNRGNTVSVGGYYTRKPLNDRNKNLLDKLCKYICECIAEKNEKQSCVDNSVNSDSTNKINGIFSGVGYILTDPSTNSWEQTIGPDGWTNAGFGPGVVRPDVSDLGWTSIMNGQPAFGLPRTLVEIKFASDRFRGESPGTIGPRISAQRLKYQQIAKRYNADLETIEMSKKGGRDPDCKCNDKDDEKSQQTEKSTSTSRENSPSLNLKQPPIFVPPGQPPFGGGRPQGIGPRGLGGLRPFPR